MFLLIFLTITRDIEKNKRASYHINDKKKGNNFKDIYTTNPTYYFFDDMINIKNNDSNKAKIDKKSYKNFFISYIEYVTV